MIRSVGVGSLLLTLSLPCGVRAQAASEPVPPLFAEHAALEMTIRANFELLRADRRESPDRAGLLTVPDGSGGTVDVGASLRTRGEFRLDPTNCFFPPLRIDVDGSDARGTILEGQDDLKLVSSCRPGRPGWEQFVLNEYLSYRAYQLVTEGSYQVRLLRATFIDTAEEHEPETRWAFVVEEDEVVAERLGAEVFELDGNENLPAHAFDPVARMTNAVFQYMIGNTDWSDVAGHNVDLFERSGVAVAVPFDFDFAGIVDAPYATANPDYQLDSVRERYYRGWCENPFTTRTVLDAFRGARDEILGLWAGSPHLDEETRGRSLRYLEEFFDAIETDERAERRFLRDCREIT